MLSRRRDNDSIVAPFNKYPNMGSEAEHLVKQMGMRDTCR